MINKLYDLTTKQFTKLEERLKTKKISNIAMITGAVGCIVLTAVLLASDPTFASEKALEERIGAVGQLFRGVGAQSGLIVSTVLGAVFAAVKGGVPAFLAVVGCGIGLNYYLGWLDTFGK